MNLTQLRAFHAVAQEGSFTKAAERLCITQPAVTASIAALEERHGVALFHRQGRNITLTKAGEDLASVSRQLFALEEEATEILASQQQLETGMLRLCVGSPYTVAPYLKRFRESYPGIDIQVIPGNFDRVREMLLSENADIAVQTGAEDMPQVGRLPCAQQRLVAFCRRGFPLPDEVHLTDLRRFDLVTREEGSATRRFFEALCTEREVEIPIRITAENRETVFELVANGLGYGIVLSGELPEDRRIRTVPIKEAETPIADYVLYLKRRQNLRLIKAFLDIVRHH